MNLYLISQDERDDYDTFDAMVVAAPDEETARNIHPYSEDKDEDNCWDCSSWASSPENVKTELIGKALRNQKQGIILVSFNAG